MVKVKSGDVAYSTNGIANRFESLIGVSDLHYSGRHSWQVEAQKIEEGLAKEKFDPEKLAQEIDEIEGGVPNQTEDPEELDFRD